MADRIPRVLLASSAVRAGKSAFSLGLAIALKKKNLNPSFALTKADFYQVILLSRLTKRATRIIDRNILSVGQTLGSLAYAGLGADLVIVEGSGSYVGESQSISDAEVGISTKTPVVLMADVEQLGGSLQALLKGYFDSLPDSRIAALIAAPYPIYSADNSERDVSRTVGDIAELIGRYSLPKLLGQLPKLSCNFSQLPENDFSEMRNLTLLDRLLLVEIGEWVDAHVDLDLLLDVGATAQSIKQPQIEGAFSSRRARIAVSLDSCFVGGFQENIEFLKLFGGEVVPFSPLSDRKLPERIGAIYLTGGFVKDYVDELNSNGELREEIKRFADSGGVIYGEGAGAAYLCKSISLDGGKQTVKGIGLIASEAVWVGDARQSYIECRTIEDSILGSSGEIVRGVNFNSWKLPGDYSRLVKVFSAGYLDSGISFTEGYSPTANSLATFSFLHFGSNPKIAKRIVDAAEVALR
ncbi:MAG TPA: hypothetical protein PKD37_03380 [Oligoflexia bacterium]|nr:hypothetical protein [Oligoflexia bacterium]HMP27011.1 hypothetical protein [Oligoflexia bacterium]